METPKPMQSTIAKSDTELIILTPNKKSWALIIFFSLLTLQFLNGAIQLPFASKEESIAFRIIMEIVCMGIVYLGLKVLLWQIKGASEIKITAKELRLSKKSPLWKKTRTYNIADIKSIEIKDESVSIGPMAMLQLLSIKHNIRLNITYGFETITILSGVDIAKATEIKSNINTFINNVNIRA
jgi:hypothetical protein